MTKPRITVTEIECKRCGHKWLPRKAVVTLCPHCHSAYFNKPRTPKKTAG